MNRALHARIQIEPEKAWITKAYALGTFDGIPIQLVTLAVEAAELVLPLFESERPEDERPRLALRVIRSWLRAPQNLDLEMQMSSAHMSMQRVRDEWTEHKQGSAYWATCSAHSAVSAALALSEGWFNFRSGVGFSWVRFSWVRTAGTLAEAAATGAFLGDRSRQCLIDKIRVIEDQIGRLSEFAMMNLPQPDDEH